MTSNAATVKKGITYPERDGKPVADNTLQFRWIVTLQGGLDALFAGDPNVFVAGDLLWYPVEGEPGIRQAPDVLVVLGRPKGDRGSYRQWEEGGMAPQVVFEVLSPGNTAAEMIGKFAFYEEYGVEEYYVCDPDHNQLTIYHRKGDSLLRVRPAPGWVSPRLGIRFDLSGPELQIFRPDGQRFLNYVELEGQLQKEQREKEQAQQSADKLRAQLKALGIEPEA